MKYKIIQRTIYGNLPLREDGYFSLGGNVRQFNTKGEAAAFIVKHLHAVGMVDYVVKEVDE